MENGAGTESRAWLLTVHDIAAHSPDGGSVLLGGTEYWVTTVRLEGPPGLPLSASGGASGQPTRLAVLVTGRDGVLTPLDMPSGGRILNIGRGARREAGQRPGVLRPATGDEIARFRADQYDLLWRFQSVVRTMGIRGGHGPVLS